MIYLPSRDRVGRRLWSWSRLTQTLSTAIGRSHLPTSKTRKVLYQKNIEAVCSSEAEVREQIRLTVIHELGHYFGMDEEQLKDV